MEVLLVLWWGRGGCWSIGSSVLVEIHKHKGCEFSYRRSAACFVGGFGRMLDYFLNCWLIVCISVWLVRREDVAWFSNIFEWSCRWQSCSGKIEQISIGPAHVNGPFMLHVYQYVFWGTRTEPKSYNVSWTVWLKRALFPASACIQSFQVTFMAFLALSGIMVSRCQGREWEAGALMGLPCLALACKVYPSIPR